MRTKRLTIVCFLFLVFSASSCCTKEDCQEPRPVLHIKIKDTTNNFAFILLRKHESGVFLKAAPEYYGHGILNISYWPEYSYRDAGPFNNTLQFKINKTVVDSITNFTFDWPKVSIPCGTCFPFGKGSTESRVVKNVSYVHKGQTYGLADTIFVVQ